MASLFNMSSTFADICTLFVNMLMGSSKAESKAAPVRSLPPNQMKFLVSFGWKFRDHILCQKLHICTYHQQNFFDDNPLWRSLAPPLPQKWRC